MSKAIKQMQMEDLRGTFKNVRDLVVLSLNKLDSAGEYSLRSSLRKKGIRLKTVKNTLCRRVFKDFNFSIPDKSPYWSNMTVMAFGGNSISELSKEIEAELKNPKNAGLYKDKDKEKVIVKGAIADGSPVTFDQALKMPTRQDLIAQIISMIGAPGGNLIATLTGVGNQIASQVQQLTEKKDEVAPTA
ncbi:MAG: 50S ribosomal protein L10 [Planctomycetia bacterium]|nr:50S ribosomal protein L10 [Planctomycetia bacterium]